MSEVGENGDEAIALAVEGVSHSFGNKAALDQVSLQVPAGRFVALLGVNGAGKTTLFSLIARLYDNVSGSIKVCGHDVRRKPGPALARMGVVFQSRALDADLTVRQNLDYHAALHGMARAATRARADELLERMGLNEQARARVSTLSGGQVRRAEITRALLHGPKVLLLDEPTVGLDVKARREVIGMVRDLVAREGVAVLWATHLFDEIEPEDSVVVLHKGSVLARDTAGDLAGERALADAFLALTGLKPKAAT